MLPVSGRCTPPVIQARRSGHGCGWASRTKQATVLATARVQDEMRPNIGLSCHSSLGTDTNNPLPATPDVVALRRSGSSSRVVRLSMWLAASNMLTLLLGARGQTMPGAFLLAMSVSALKHRAACWNNSRFRSITQTAHATAATTLSERARREARISISHPPSLSDLVLPLPTHTPNHPALISSIQVQSYRTIVLLQPTAKLTRRIILPFSSDISVISAYRRLQAILLTKGPLKTHLVDTAFTQARSYITTTSPTQPLFDSVLLNQHQSSKSPQLNPLNQTTKHQQHPPKNHNDFHPSPARPGSSPSAQRLLQHRRHHSRIPSLCFKTAQQPLPSRRPSRRDLRATTIAAPFKACLCLRHP